jgi:hypothetical protein
MFVCEENYKRITFKIWLDYKEPAPDIKSPPHMMMYWLPYLRILIRCTNIKGTVL